MAGLGNLLDALGPFRSGDVLTAEALQTMLESLRIALNITGPNVIMTRDGIHIRRDPRKSNRGWFWARITGSQQLNAGDIGVQWEYSFVEVTRNILTSQWDTLTNGRTSNGFSNAAENSLEDGNTPPNAIPGDATGIINPGVDMDGPDYPGGFSPMPISGGVVPMFIDDTTGKYFFCVGNAHDGTCAA